MQARLGKLPGCRDPKPGDSLGGDLSRPDLLRIVKSRLDGSVLAEFDPLVFKLPSGIFHRSRRAQLPVHDTPPGESRFQCLGTYRGPNCPPAPGVAIHPSRNIAVGDDCPSLQVPYDRRYHAAHASEDRVGPTCRPVAAAPASQTVGMVLRRPGRCFPICGQAPRFQPGPTPASLRNRHSRRAEGSLPGQSLATLPNFGPIFPDFTRFGPISQTYLSRVAANCDAGRSVVPALRVPAIEVEAGVWIAGYKQAANGHALARP